MTTTLSSNQIRLIGTIYEQKTIPGESDLLQLVIAGNNHGDHHQQMPFYLPVEIQRQTMQQVKEFYGDPNPMQVFTVKVQASQAQRSTSEGGPVRSTTVLQVTSIDLLHGTTVKQQDLIADRTLKSRYRYGSNMVDLECIVSKVYPLNVHPKPQNKTTGTDDQNTSPLRITEVQVILRQPKGQSVLTVAFFNQCADEAQKIRSGNKIRVKGIIQHKNGYIKVKSECFEMLQTP